MVILMAEWMDASMGGKRDDPKATGTGMSKDASKGVRREHLMVPSTD